MLAAGGFGCVFRPRISCSGKPTKSSKEVTKVQADDQAARNEVSISQIVRTIPGYARYFGVVKSACPIQSSKITPLVTETCGVIKDVANLLLLTFDYVPNVSMHKVAMASLSRREDVYVLLHSYALLLESLVRLASVNILHMDLKAENVLYDAVYHLPVIIDFGIATNMQKLTPAKWKVTFYVFAPEYYIWPPEINLIAYLLHVNDSPTEQEISLMADAIMKNNKALDRLPTVFREKWATSFVAFCLPFLGRPSEEVIHELTSFWKTWDNYSLSVMYVKFFSDWDAAHTATHDFSMALLEPLLFSLHADPRMRYDAGTSLAKYQEAFRSDLSIGCVVSDLNSFRTKGQ